MDCPNQALPLRLAELSSCSTIASPVIPVKCDNKDYIQFEMPTDVHSELRPVAQELKLFSKQLEQMNVTKYVIYTVEAVPIKLPWPPRQIHFHMHYADQL